MRFHLIGLVLLAGTAFPALAQRAEPVERRVERLEQELRAVQRRVFPNGRVQFVEPEISAPEQAPPPLSGSGDALASVTARVDAMEAQLRALTGQIEEQGFRSRQLEQQVAELRTRLEAREAAPALPAPDSPPPATERPRAAAPADGAARPSTPAAASPAAAADAAEEAYNAGFRLWNTQRYGEAQQALETAIQAHPGSRWTSWMRNLQGRAYLDDNKPATAARIFLANYQENPRGERAADSLFFLGQSLTRLNRRSEACRVYGELEQVYPNMRSFLRERLPQARTDARCASGAAAR